MFYFSLDNRIIIVYLAAFLALNSVIASFLLLSYTLTPPPLPALQRNAIPALQRNTPSFILLSYTTTTS
ncbi:unnamed protein product [Brassica oleracea var. botrytis]|uniref:Uncharacterized protein n=1 Tax=Brassica oleracea TaxID=3712 RepID=A0A3P6EVC7_BRAOL|nr:unnamed protein product [Brassica oleracea]